jgi:hypothetical protein
MKKLLTVAAVAALFTVSPALAEPSQDSEIYHYIGGDSEIMSLAADSIETKGQFREVWVLHFFRKVQNIDGISAQGMWTLTRIDCDAYTYEVTRSEAVADKANINAELRIARQSIIDNSPMDGLADAVCFGEGSGLKSMSVDDAVKAMQAFRKSSRT